MHILVVNFQVKGIDDEHFRKACDDLAPAFASVPGLISKVWLADTATGTYGGIYIWRDPHLANITTKDYGVLEAPTRITRGLITADV